MHCITVFPILKTTFSDTLTYWTKELCHVGDIIQVKIQNRTVWAVVDSIVPIQQAKEYIKSQTFTIKKIEQIVRAHSFSREFILAVLDTAQYYVKPFGEVLAELVPKKILEHLEQYIAVPATHIDNTKLKTRYMQIPLPARVEAITQIYTENTWTLSPIKTHVAYLKKAGLEHVIMPIDLYRLDQAHSPTLIMELASSEYYRHMRKDFDYRFFVRSFAKHKNIQLIESDALLPLYTENHTDTLDYTIPSKPTIHLVDMTESGKTKIKSKEKLNTKLHHISPGLAALIKHCEKHDQSLMLYTVRKGFSAQTVCADCATVVSCTTCKRPLRITETPHVGKIFTCDTCNTTNTTNSTCIHCGGWNLVSLGASTESVREELQALTDLPIVLIDSNNQTKSSAAKALKQHKTATIYLGTELLLTQSHGTVFDYSAIVSLESMLALPSRTAEFDAIRVIYTLMERTERDVLIQTRNPKHPIWQAVAQKNWKPLVDDIQTIARETQQPPWSVHIQIHSKTHIDTIYEYLKRFTTVYKTMQADHTTLHLFFKPQEWPHPAIYPYLKSVPKYVHIYVDRTSFI